MSSGQAKDRWEQTTETPDMEVTSRGSRRQERHFCLGSRQGEGRDDNEATTAVLPRTGRWPVGSGYHPEMSSSTTMSGLLNA
ncbi:hypothetical protein GCM10010218_60700 [Streptomyces mashuensis]|uniref:Uncharacterized protein n=1 Tax=Streptomyces mashuensis TaxID=33904 RepID=A0A919B8E3_9ACTN|nr:hypothetical protein GCM10010218_60700 [Streptomyces mashuensis]